MNSLNLLVVDNAKRSEMHWREEKRSKGRTTMERLPNDLTAEILSHLPLRALLRCRRVCKLWRCLISSHPIIPSRCGQGSSSGFFVFGTFSGEAPSDFKMAFINSLDEDMTSSYEDAGFLLTGIYQSNAVARPLSICNGLIFYRSLGEYSKDDFCICNPETRERIMIPKFTIEGIHLISGLAFDPTVTDSSHCNTASYKLVIAALKPRLQFKVYSSEARAWTEPSPSLYPVQRCYRRLNGSPPSSVFYHGVLHWLVDIDCLLTFDPKSETSRWVETPKVGDLMTADNCQPARLVEWEGELYYVRIATTLRLDVWKMSDYSCCSSFAKWVLLHSIEGFIPRVLEDLHLPNLPGLYPHLSTLYPLAVDNGGGRIMFCTHWCSMVLYDLRTKRVAQSPIDHWPTRKHHYNERNGPWYIRYIPTTKFLTK